MSFKATEIVDTGVDYLTTTTREPHKARLLLVQADKLIQQEARRGFFVRGWSMSGYSGWSCGGIQAGERQDGAIVRLSSELASLHWWDFYQTTGRATRLDLQVTCRVEQDPAQDILRLSSDVHRYYVGRSDGPKLTLWTNNNDGVTFYVGSRQSDFYFRAYNKESESALVEYERCVRLELEIKKRQTVSTIDWLLSQESVASGIRSRIGLYMDQHGISHNLITCQSTLACQRQPRGTDCLKALEWLRSQVRPTIEKLSQVGMEHEARECLGLPLVLAQNLS